MRQGSFSNNIAYLKERVRKRFGRGLHDFLKEKIEGEGLFDYEVAALLDVSPTLVRRFRLAYGLTRNRRAGFRRCFERKYGPGAVNRFRELIEAPGTSLQDLAQHFGFSREYARQVFQKIYGFPYGWFKPGRRGRRPRREVALERRCTSMGQ